MQTLLIILAILLLAVLSYTIDVYIMMSHRQKTQMTYLQNCQFCFLLVEDLSKLIAYYYRKHQIIAGNKIFTTFIRNFHMEILILRKLIIHYLIENQTTFSIIAVKAVMPAFNLQLIALSHIKQI